LIAAEGDREEFEAFAVVALEHARHQARDGAVVEVGGDIGEADAVVLIARVLRKRLGKGGTSCATQSSAQRRCSAGESETAFQLNGEQTRLPSRSAAEIWSLLSSSDRQLQLWSLE
jgi:hypothetical protein